MPAPRKIPLPEAQRRYDAGESISALAAEYGVTTGAVWQTVTPKGRASAARLVETVRSKSIGKGRCERCGAPTNLHGQIYGGARLCVKCGQDATATSVRESQLRCFGCGEWKPDEDFPRSASLAGTRRRGRHRQCRGCNTIARQRYRERNKVPCIRCGKPALPPNEKVTGGTSFPRCRECMHEDQRAARRELALKRRTHA
jgi:hypothetical protein